MKMFKCNFIGMCGTAGDRRLQVELLEDHDKLGGLKGECTITSPVKLIDFERKYAITANNMYKWD